jgi:DNA-binding phage protein
MKKQKIEINFGSHAELPPTLSAAVKLTEQTSAAGIGYRLKTKKRTKPATARAALAAYLDNIFSQAEKETGGRVDYIVAPMSDIAEESGVEKSSVYRLLHDSTFPYTNAELNKENIIKHH